jgi:hypothetical protein
MRGRSEMQQRKIGGVVVGGGVGFTQEKLTREKLMALLP